MRFVGWSIAGLAWLVGSACAASTLPPTEASETSERIRKAVTVGASEIPAAARYLEMARASWRSARSLADGGDVDEAALALERARADAELALALVWLEETRSQAREALWHVRQLQEEMPDPDK